MSLSVLLFKRYLFPGCRIKKKKKNELTDPASWP